MKYILIELFNFFIFIIMSKYLYIYLKVFINLTYILIIKLYTWCEPHDKFFFANRFLIITSRHTLNKIYTNKHFLYVKIIFSKDMSLINMLLHKNPRISMAAQLQKLIWIETRVNYEQILNASRAADNDI